MSEEKQKCEKCGKDNVSAKVEAYSREHFDGHVYCYDCQKLVDSAEPKEEAAPEEESKKGTLEGYVDKGDDEMREYDEEVGAEVEAEEKELNERIIALVTAMSVPDESGFYAWLESEFGVKKIADLDLQDKRKVMEETKRLADKMGEGKVIDAEVVDEGEESKWQHTVEIDEGTFAFKDGDGVVLCKNGASDNVYELRIDIPECSCRNFQITKERQEWCKHLKAASAAKYPVKELPKVPAEVEKALAKSEKEKQKKGKVKKEELVKVVMFDKEVNLEVQVPTEIIKSEDHAVELIKTILGDHPDKGNVIMSYAGIEELSADVVLSLSQAIGIRYMPLVYEKEVVKMNLGDVYLATANEEQKRKYGAVAKMLPAVNIVTHCRITTIAGWKDKSGNVRFAAGTKEEYLAPHDLLDISRRSSAFLLTKCETKSAKKAILNCLPVTDDGLIQKIKEVYKWK